MYLVLVENILRLYDDINDTVLFTNFYFYFNHYFFIKQSDREHKKTHIQNTPTSHSAVQDLENVTIT